jgi:uncharacterized protein (DUF2147 family)
MEGKTIMKTMIFAAAALALVSTVASANEIVNGYMRQNGTQVQPYWRSDRDGDASNNWSTRGNVNPYTGATGTHSQQPNSLSGSCGMYRIC